MPATNILAHGPSPLYPVIEKLVRDEAARIDKEQLTPFAFLNAGTPVRVRDFHGKEKVFQGIQFDGSVRLYFWNAYVQPFLEKLAFDVVEETLKRCKENNVPKEPALRQAQGLLQSYIGKTIGRMVDIDRRLRGKGHPESVGEYNPAKELKYLEEFVARRIEGELQMIPPKESRWQRANKWFKDHPLLGWIVATTLAAIGLLVKFFGGS